MINSERNRRTNYARATICKAGLSGIEENMVIAAEIEHLQALQQMAIHKTRGI